MTQLLIVRKSPRWSDIPLDDKVNILREDCNRLRTDPSLGQPQNFVEMMEELDMLPDAWDLLERMWFHKGAGGEVNTSMAVLEQPPVDTTHIRADRFILDIVAGDETIRMDPLAFESRVVRRVHFLPSHGRMVVFYTHPVMMPGVLEPVHMTMAFPDAKNVPALVRYFSNDGRNVRSLDEGAHKRNLQMLSDSYMNPIFAHAWLMNMFMVPDLDRRRSGPRCMLDDLIKNVMSAEEPRMHMARAIERFVFWVVPVPEYLRDVYIRHEHSLPYFMEPNALYVRRLCLLFVDAMSKQKWKK